MPTTAATGTKHVKTAGASADDKPAKAAKPVGQPLADPNGNGTVQVVSSDGSITSVDAAAPGWEDEVRAINPKHPSLSRD
jgi:hypothetical protein